MFTILKKPAWSMPERMVTPEEVYSNRRAFLRQMGFSGAGILAGLAGGCSGSAELGAAEPARALGAGPGAALKAARNPEFNPAGKLTAEEVAARYNNFYEFTTVKDRVHRMVDRFVVSPWEIEVSGLVESPWRGDVEEMIRDMPLEERVYRFRCVEAWAMVVPWTGFPLRKLLEKVRPKSEAKYVRFVTFNRPEQAPGMADTRYPWPYTEGLRLDEAMNPLAFMAVGIYGKRMPKQHGAPIRLVTPWKYGYKSIKSVVKIELVSAQPATLWETLAPDEYPFESNVDPGVPHPRWSQATERMIDSGDRVKTRLYNGYGSYVADLYKR